MGGRRLKELLFWWQKMSQAKNHLLCYAIEISIELVLIIIGQAEEEMVERAYR